MTLAASLRRWANARDRRYEQNHRHGAHGKTGTALLREAVDEIERLNDERILLRVLEDYVRKGGILWYGTASERVVVGDALEQLDSLRQEANYG